jgi:hypothetical protein
MNCFSGFKIVVPNAKLAGTFEMEPVYTQTNSRIGISAASLAPKFDDLK